MADGSCQDFRNESLAVQVLFIVPLAQYLLEESLSTCSVACRKLRQHAHSRANLRQLASSLPPVVNAVERRRLWRRLCVAGLPGADRTGSQEYQRLADSESVMDCEIRRDIGRTFPEDFGELQMEALFRILRAVSHRVEDVRYCQGMNFVAGTFIRVFGAEAEALVYQCCLSILLRHGMNQFFGHNFPKLRLVALQFDCLVEAFLPDLSERFEVYNVGAEYYATQWFLTLFSYSLPFPHIVRVWDQFLCRGIKFIHRVGLALLQQARTTLLSLPFDGIVKELKTMGKSLTLSPEEFVAEALSFKVTNRLLCELEHALAVGNGAQAPNGSRAMPCCFPERNLDRGKVRWRVVTREDNLGSGSPGQASTRERAATTCTNGSEETFVDSSLPAPRVPMDPYAPELFLPQAVSQPALTKEAKRKRGHLHRLGKLPAAFKRAGVAGEGRAPKIPQGDANAGQLTSRSSPSPSVKGRALRRSSSMPAPRFDGSRIEAAERLGALSASSSCCSIDSALPAATDMQAAGNRITVGEVEPQHVEDVPGSVFTIKDLDTGLVSEFTDTRSGLELSEQLSPTRATTAQADDGTKHKSRHRKQGLWSRTLRRHKPKDHVTPGSPPSTVEVYDSDWVGVAHKR